jgi:hypothetical protein
MVNAFGNLNTTPVYKIVLSQRARLAAKAIRLPRMIRGFDSSRP